MKAIIFDMDGIIFDTENMFLNIWRKIADDYGLADIDSVYRKVIGVKAEITKTIYQEAYGEDFAYDELNRLALERFYEQEEKAGIPMKTGVIELLGFLRSNGYRIGLASSTKTEIVKRQLGQSNLLRFFEVVVGGDMVGKSKPEPDIFLEACRQLSAPPAATYAVEDSFNGVRAAHAAGMKVIMVPDIVLPDAEIKELTEKIYPSLIEVLEYLKKHLHL